MGVYAQLRRFVQTHRRCGVLRDDAERPTAWGCRLCVTCPCGAWLERWVTLEAADEDLLRSAPSAFEN